jgi:hypothetical protein
MPGPQGRKRNPSHFSSPGKYDCTDNVALSALLQGTKLRLLCGDTPRPTCYRNVFITPSLYNTCNGLCAPKQSFHTLLASWHHPGDKNMKQLTWWGRGFPETLTDPQLLKKLPAFHRTRGFITAFTKERHQSVSILVLSPSTPGSSKWSPSLRFPHQNQPQDMLHALRIPVFLIWSPELYLVRRTQHETRHYSPLHSLVTSSLVGPNTLFTTLFSKTHSEQHSHKRETRNMTEKVAEP